MRLSNHHFHHLYLRLRDTRGISFLEITLYTLLSISILKAGAAGIRVITKNQSSVTTFAKNEETRRLLKLQLSQALKVTITENVLLSNDLAQFMGIGSQVGWNWNSPPCPMFMPSVPFCGSVLVPPNRHMGAASGSVASADPFDLIILLTRDVSAPTLSLTSDVSYPNPSSPSVLNGSTHFITVTGDTSSYKKEDVVAIVTPYGLQLLPLFNDGTTSTLNFQVMYPMLPVRNLAAGSLIFKVRTLMMGTDISKTRLRMVKIQPKTALYQDVVNEPLNLVSAQVAKLTNVLDPTSWSLVGSGHFKPSLTPNALRINWATPITTSLNSSYNRTLELGL